MSAFGDEDFDIDMAIEQSLLDEDMHLLPPSQSVGQLAPQEEMQSWIDAVENVAAVEDPVVPSVPSVLGSPLASLFLHCHIFI